MAKDLPLPPDPGAKGCSTDIDVGPDGINIDWEQSGSFEIDFCTSDCRRGTAYVKCTEDDGFVIVGHSFCDAPFPIIDGPPPDVVDCEVACAPDPVDPTVCGPCFDEAQEVCGWVIDSSQPCNRMRVTATRWVRTCFNGIGELTGCTLIGTGPFTDSAGTKYDDAAVTEGCFTCVTPELPCQPCNVTIELPEGEVDLDVLFGTSPTGPLLTSYWVDAISIADQANPSTMTGAPPSTPVELYATKCGDRFQTPPICGVKPHTFNIQPGDCIVVHATIEDCP